MLGCCGEKVRECGSVVGGSSLHVAQPRHCVLLDDTHASVPPTEPNQAVGAQESKCEAFGQAEADIFGPLVATAAFLTQFRLKLPMPRIVQKTCMRKSGLELSGAGAPLSL